MSGEQGRLVTFECEITGSPRPEYRWFKGARELVDTPKFSIFCKGDKQSLMINNVQPEDVDEYTCRATNSAGTKTTRAELFLLCKLIYAQSIITCRDVGNISESKNFAAFGKSYRKIKEDAIVIPSHVISLKKSQFLTQY